MSNIEQIFNIISIVVLSGLVFSMGYILSSPHKKGEKKI